MRMHIATKLPLRRLLRDYPAIAAPAAPAKARQAFLYSPSPKLRRQLVSNVPQEKMTAYSGWSANMQLSSTTGNLGATNVLADLERSPLVYPPAEVGKQLEKQNTTLRLRENNLLCPSPVARGHNLLRPF
jgi:hypothetical protein